MYKCKTVSVRSKNYLISLPQILIKRWWYGAQEQDGNKKKKKKRTWIFCNLGETSLQDLHMETGSTQESWRTCTWLHRLISKWGFISVKLENISYFYRKITIIVMLIKEGRSWRKKVTLSTAGYSAVTLEHEGLYKKFWKETKNVEVQC